jgi:hypothetical protein
MTAILYLGLGSLTIAAVALWIYAFRDLSRNTTFSTGSKTVWFWIILLGPVGGSVAYFSAKRSVEKFSQPDATRVSKLLSKR